MNAKTVFLHHDISGYPSKEYTFSPSKRYPEAPFKEVACEPNEAYDMVRELLHGASLDEDHFGSPEWNPFGKFIKCGDTVLLKPNWVMHVNHNKTCSDNLDCLVTHPSIVRAVLDYVVIAARVAGDVKIFLADAPMQGCDLDTLFNRTGYNLLFDFYRHHGVDIYVHDLRMCHVNINSGNVISKPILTNSGLAGVTVELGNLSEHSGNDGKGKRYKVSDYRMKDTGVFHHDGRHAYVVNELVLNSDVIINLPKPKTHRLAGYTGAMKNFVGIVYDKASLPHRSAGSKVEGGDAYAEKSFLKRWMDLVDDIGTGASQKEHYLRARICKFLTKSFYVMSRVTGKDKFRIGSWFGNDTIWRTVADLNKIVCYADKNGVMHSLPQRKIISIGDMIIAGEKSGPVAPQPKKEGVLLYSDDVVTFDYVLCKLIGYNPESFALLRDMAHVENVFLLVEDEVSGYRGKACLLQQFVPDSRLILEKHPNWVTGK